VAGGRQLVGEVGGGGGGGLNVDVDHVGILLSSQSLKWEPG
jgi:hypothetical protein